MANVNLNHDPFYRTPDALMPDARFRETPEAGVGKTAQNRPYEQHMKGRAERPGVGEDKVEISEQGRTAWADGQNAVNGEQRFSYRDLMKVEDPNAYERFMEMYGKDEPDAESQDFERAWIRDNVTNSADAKARLDGYQKVFSMLQKKYGNADVMIAGQGDDLSKLSGQKAYSIILSPEEMKLLASDAEADKEARAKLLQEIEDAMNGVGDMDKQLQDVKSRFGDFRFGLRMDENNQWMFFAQKGDKTFEASSILELIKTIDFEPKDPADDLPKTPEPPVTAGEN